jgi:DNA-binding response OmpR family regulator
MASRILVVDDDPNALRLIGYSLQQEGYEVLTASNGLDGLALVKQQHPDLVVLDVMMPDVDGFEVCRRLRDDPATRQLPIILLTAKGQASDKITGFRAGADDYVVKPADPNELVARVGALLTRASYAKRLEGRVVAFMGAKGGVGTSTVAVNVAASMGRAGHKVVLADLRGSFGTVCLSLGIRPRASVGWLFHEGQARTQRDIVGALADHPTGIEVLASPQDTDEYVELTPAIASSIVAALRDHAAFVVLDLPAGLSSWQRDTLQMSDFVALVTEQDPVSLACAKMALTVLKVHDTTPSHIGTVLVHRARTFSEMSAMQICGSLQVGLLGVVPSAPEEFASAARLGSPIVVSQPTVAASLALTQIAERLSAEHVVLQQF